MKLKDATPEQIQKVTELFGEELSLVRVNGILELPSGEEFLQFEIISSLDWVRAPPIVNYSLYAIPLTRLDEENLALGHYPRVSLSLYSTVAWTGYPLSKVVLNHIAKTYPELEPETLFCVELESTYTVEHCSKGLGSHMLPWALTRCQQVCLEKDMVITHVEGSAITPDASRLKYGNQFYHRLGFRQSDFSVYRMIYPLRADASKSL